jgi:hypothetical protein
MKFRSPFRRSKTTTPEASAAASRGGKQRFIIHAGFSKCGSSSIQGTLFENFARLRADGISIFGKDLRIAKSPADLGAPLWCLEDAREKGERLTEKLGEEIASVTTHNTDCIAVLSAENLGNPAMAELFAGLDQQIEVALVFYLRPQFEWIPSAWKQWGLKKGTPIDEFVTQCLETRRPAFRRSIEAWKSLLPAASLHVRFLIPELLRGGNPVKDFFHLLGLPEGKYAIGDEPRNPSLDFSVLHVLSKNPQLFSGVHDNQLMRALRSTLSKKFRSTNIRMLSSEQEARIEECFREENLWLLKRFCTGIDVNHIYRTYFTPQAVDARYSSMNELDLIYRCLGIILKSIAIRNDAAASNDSGAPSGPEPED